MSRIPSLVLSLLVLFVCVLVGYMYGKDSVQEQWDKQKLTDALNVQKLQQDYKEKEKTHTQITEELRREIKELEHNYKASIDNARDEYVSRLRDSETRASIYKRQAESGTIEHRNLANYAAELDKSLERGRDLVRRLRITLGQREREIGILSQQIHADRSILDKADSVNGN